MGFFIVTLLVIIIKSDGVIDINLKVNI